ncbi:MAG: hypothetical protein ACI80N_002653, partial [Gammaproteobacteria bacterium]
TRDVNVFDLQCEGTRATEPRLFRNRLTHAF